MKIAIIDKQPGNIDYIKYFGLDEYTDSIELHSLVQTKMSKVLRKDVTLEFDDTGYDFVVLVGAEACKFIANVSSPTANAGLLIEDKYIPMMNPSVLSFKPAMQPMFDISVKKCAAHICGTYKEVILDVDHTEDGKVALEWLKEALNYDVIALDSETSSFYIRDGYLLGISITWAKDQGKYISADVLDEERIEVLQEILDTKTCVFHNAKFDIKWFEYHLGLKVPFVHDTMLLHYLLDETQGSHGLKALALKYTGYGDYDAELADFKDAYCKRHGINTTDFSYAFIPFDIIGKYAAIDTAATFVLYEKFMPIVAKSEQLNRVYNDIMVPGMRFLLDIEENGVPFDGTRLQLAQTQMDSDIGVLKSEIYDYPEVKALEAELGKVFNPNSVQQLRTLLFTHCGLRPTGRKTGTGADSTDAIVLAQLAEQHPLPKLILDIRQKTKIKSTYLDKIISGIDPDGRLRTGFNITSTTSGRLSSSGKLNMQQLPRDNKLVKGCIKAPEGYKIVSQDLGTAEMYYAAALSGDKKLQGVFQSGSDFHSTIAHQVFGLPCEISEVSSLYGSFRQAAKAISFGILYGSGPAKVAETVSTFNAENGINESFTVEDAKEAIALYFKTYSTLKAWLASCQKEIKTKGCIYSAFGRKRRLRDVFSNDKGLAGSQVRSGVNFLIQSVASDVNLMASIDLNNCIKKEHAGKAEIFALVHDSIISLVRDDFVEEYCELAKTITQMDRGVSISNSPITVDTEIGQDYSFDGFEKQYPELFEEAG